MNDIFSKGPFFCFEGPLYKSMFSLSQNPRYCHILPTKLSDSSPRSSLFNCIAALMFTRFSVNLFEKAVLFENISFLYLGTNKFRPSDHLKYTWKLV